MAGGSSVGEPETSDDDSVSLTSTVVDDEDKEYEVEGIVAERRNEGVMEYLTLWVGYPGVEALWERRELFNPLQEGEHDVFKEWQERKMRISRGYERPFNVEDWQRRQDEFRQENKNRRARRRRKKAKLNHEMDALISDSESSFEYKPKLVDSQELGIWTDPEKSIFLKGLQDANGANWNKIFGWYGERGTFNQLLKSKTHSDMQKQLEMLRQEFVTAGRDPPKYMNVSKSLKHTAVQPRDEFPSANGTRQGGGPDSQQTSVASSSKAVKDEKILQHTHSSEHAVDTVNAAPIAQATNPKVGEERSSSLEQRSRVSSNAHHFKGKDSTSAQRNAAPGKRAIDITINASASPKSHPESINLPLSPSKAPKKPYLGTARSFAERPNANIHVNSASRTNSLRGGPARLSAPRRKLSSIVQMKKPSVGAIDVTANWNGQPKSKKTRTLPTTNADISIDKPIRKFKSFRTLNSVRKGRASEPAPDPTQLVFLDPRTGKAPKESVVSPSTHGGTIIPATSEFQEPSDELAPKKASPFESIDHGSAIVGDNNDSLFVDNVDSGMVSEADQADEANKETLLSTNPEVQNSPRFPVKVAPNPYANSPKSLPWRNLYFQGQSDGIIDETRPSLDLNQDVLGSKPTSSERHDLFSKIEESLVIGNMRFGSALKDAGKMKLAGFDRPVKNLLLTIKDYSNPFALYFDFTHTCTAPEYQEFSQNDPSNHVGSGYVVPYPENQGAYDSITEFLACHVSIGVCITRCFTMLLWPANSSIWSPLDSTLPEVPPGTVLRFAVRESTPSCLTSNVESPLTTRLRLEDKESHRAFSAKVSDAPIEPNENAIKICFRDISGIDFDRLIAPNGSRKRTPEKNFFLCFQPANCERYEPDEKKRQVLRTGVSEEHDLFVQFLRANGADAIYSFAGVGVSRSHSKWLLEIHESCGRPDQLPYFAKFLSRREGSINVWLTSLSSTSQDKDHNHLSLMRCFPHGGAILITISLVLYHPDEALKILRWFRLEQIPSKQPGTWKIAVRPRFREWLLEIHEICCEKTWKSPFGDFNLQVYADINIEVLLLLERDAEPFGLMVETSDIDVPLFDAPIVAEVQLPRGRKEWTGNSFETARLDHEAIRWNDDQLIQWFSEWAGDHICDHRKFQVALGYSKGESNCDRLVKGYEKGYGFYMDYFDSGTERPGRHEREKTEIGSIWERNFLEILPCNEFCKRYRVPDHATLNQKDADRRQKDKDALPALQVEADSEWREERAVARDSLAAIMQICRDDGGSEEQARAKGRRHLLWRRDEQCTASDKEVAECAIDMDWKPPNHYGQMARILSGNEEDARAAWDERNKEAKRLADKEVLSGTQERERMWQEEIKFWAERDRQKWRAGA